MIPDFDVRVIASPSGSFSLGVRITAPGVNFRTFDTVKAVPDTRTISTAQGGKTYALTVQLQADGSASAQLDVREGDEVTQTTARSFAAPAAPGLRIAPGTGDVRDVIPPKPVTQVEAVYTAEAREKGISGLVIVEALIDPQGNVEDVRVLKPLPFGLDRAAVDAVRQWKWQPATLRGEPVKVAFQVMVKFQLE